MGAAIRLIDGRANGTVVRETVLELVSERTTVRELIEQRVRTEVARFNATRDLVFNGLVQPADSEAVLNGYRLPRGRPLHADAQCARAHRAFDQNGFFMLVDDRQVESLDEVIVVAPGTRVVFVKLLPLVGG